MPLSSSNHESPAHLIITGLLAWRETSRPSLSFEKVRLLLKHGEVAQEIMGVAPRSRLTGSGSKLLQAVGNANWMIRVG